MAQLFLSYAREDRECAELLARALMDRGWSVWWDRQIQVGRPFSEVIEEELKKARCVIVLWSKHAVTSAFVRDEATRAVERNVLVPVRIENVRPPLGFGQLHFADLLHWRNGFDSPGFEACLSSVEMLVKKTTDRPLPDLPEEPVPVDKTHANDYWISQDRRQFHAPDAATLRRWAEEGRIRPQSHVYHPAFGRWIAAGEVQILQGAWPTPEPAPAPAPTPAPVRSVPREYLIRQDGEEFAAGDLETLRRWAAEGRVKGGSHVYDLARQQWGLAREIPELQSFYRAKSRDPEASRRSIMAIVIIFGAFILLMIILGLMLQTS